MRNRLLITAVLLSGMNAAQAADWNINDCAIDKDKLLAGEVQTCEKTFATAGDEGQKKGVMGILLINAPYNVVWKVISDWEAQSKFVPGLEYFKVKHVFPGGNKTSWHSLVEGKLNIPFADFRYTLDAWFDKRIGNMSWHMLSKADIQRFQQQNIPVQASDEEKLKNVEGFAQITAYDDQRTVYYYAPVVETSVPVPGFIQSAITSVSLNDYLGAIKKKAEEKAKEKASMAKSAKKRAEVAPKAAKEGGARP